MRYFTSDTHYGHANIIRYCARPYEDTGHMNADLVARALTHVPPGAQLWHLGDVALGKLQDTLPYLARIPAQVTLVAGNHDRCHPCNGARHEKFAGIYRERCALADLVLTSTTLTLSNGVQARVCHLPYDTAEGKGAGDGTRHEQVEMARAERLAPWRPADDGSWLLCGHVHDAWRQRGKMINVGVDAWGGNPVSEDALVELIGAGPRDLAPLEWE